MPDIQDTPLTVSPLEEGKQHLVPKSSSRLFPYPNLASKRQQKKLSVVTSPMSGGVEIPAQGGLKLTSSHHQPRHYVIDPDNPGLLKHGSHKGGIISPHKQHQTHFQYNKHSSQPNVVSCLSLDATMRANERWVLLNKETFQEIVDATLHEMTRTPGGYYEHRNNVCTEEPNHDQPPSPITPESHLMKRTDSNVKFTDNKFGFSFYEPKRRHLSEKNFCVVTSNETFIPEGTNIYHMSTSGLRAGQNFVAEHPRESAKTTNALIDITNDHLHSQHYQIGHSRYATSNSVTTPTNLSSPASLPSPASPRLPSCTTPQSPDAPILFPSQIVPDCENNEPLDLSNKPFKAGKGESNKNIFPSLSATGMPTTFSTSTTSTLSTPASPSIHTSSSELQPNLKLSSNSADHNQSSGESNCDYQSLPTNTIKCPLLQPTLSGEESALSGTKNKCTKEKLGSSSSSNKTYDTDGIPAQTTSVSNSSYDKLCHDEKMASSVSDDSNSKQQENYFSGDGSKKVNQELEKKVEKNKCIKNGEEIDNDHCKNRPDKRDNSNTHKPFTKPEMKTAIFKEESAPKLSSPFATESEDDEEVDVVVVTGDSCLTPTIAGGAVVEGVDDRSAPDDPEALIEHSEANKDSPKVSANNSEGCTTLPPSADTTSSSPKSTPPSPTSTQVRGATTQVREKTQSCSCSGGCTHKHTTTELPPEHKQESAFSSSSPTPHVEGVNENEDGKGVGGGEEGGAEEKAESSSQQCVGSVVVSEGTLTVTPCAQNTGEENLNITDNKKGHLNTSHTEALDKTDNTVQQGGQGSKSDKSVIDLSIPKGNSTVKDKLEKHKQDREERTEKELSSSSGGSAEDEQTTNSGDCLAIIKDKDSPDKTAHSSKSSSAFAGVVQQSTPLSLNSSQDTSMMTTTTVPQMHAHLSHHHHHHMRKMSGQNVGVVLKKKSGGSENWAPLNKSKVFDLVEEVMISLGESKDDENKGDESGNIDGDDKNKFSIERTGRTFEKKCVSGDNSQTNEENVCVDNNNVMKNCVLNLSTNGGKNRTPGSVVNGTNVSSASHSTLKDSNRIGGASTPPIQSQRSRGSEQGGAGRGQRDTRTASAKCHLRDHLSARSLARGSRLGAQVLPSDGKRQQQTTIQNSKRKLEDVVDNIRANDNKSNQGPSSPSPSLCTSSFANLSLSSGGKSSVAGQRRSPLTIAKESNNNNIHNNTFKQASPTSKSKPQCWMALNKMVVFDIVDSAMRKSDDEDNSSDSTKMHTPSELKDSVSSDEMVENLCTRKDADEKEAQDLSQNKYSEDQESTSENTSKSLDHDKTSRRTPLTKQSIDNISNFHGENLSFTKRKLCDQSLRESELQNKPKRRRSEEPLSSFSPPLSLQGRTVLNKPNCVTGLLFNIGSLRKESVLAKKAQSEVRDFIPSVEEKATDLTVSSRSGNKRSDDKNTCNVKFNDNGCSSTNDENMGTQEKEMLLKAQRSKSSEGHKLTSENVRDGGLSDAVAPPLREMDELHKESKTEAGEGEGKGESNSSDGAKFGVVPIATSSGTKDARGSPRLGWIAVSKIDVHNIVDSVVDSMIAGEIMSSQIQYGNDFTSIEPEKEPRGLAKLSSSPSSLSSNPNKDSEVCHQSHSAPPSPESSSCLPVRSSSTSTPVGSPLPAREAEEGQLKSAGAVTSPKPSATSAASKDIQSHPEIDSPSAGRSTPSPTNSDPTSPKVTLAPPPTTSSPIPSSPSEVAEKGTDPKILTKGFKWKSRVLLRVEEEKIDVTPQVVVTSPTSPSSSSSPTTVQQHKQQGRSSGRKEKLKTQKGKRKGSPSLGGKSK